MSASIHTLLADELGISDAKAKKLLSAMLREVRKRAKAGGVRLPNLGKFKETDGRLSFSPEESLVRAVNHRFEGLASEDLGSAPMDDDEDESPEEPSTITLGYQDSSNWSPLESEADEAANETDDESDEAPDTAEFQVPDAEATDAAPEASSEADATSDAAPSSESSAEPPSDPESASSGPKETEKLYPLVEDVPTGSDQDDEGSADAPSSPPEETASDAPSAPEATDEDDEDAAVAPDTSSDPEEPDPSTSSDDFFGPSDDREHDTLSGIWDSVDEEVEESERDIPSPEEPSAAAEDSGPSPGDPEADDGPDGTMPDLSEISPSEQEPEEEPEPEETTQTFEAASPDEDKTAPAPAASKEDTSSSSTGSLKTGPDSVDPASGSSIPRIIVSVFVFLMLGGGAWYILGQRGMVQSPRATLAQLQSAVQSGGAGSNNSTSSVPEFSPESSSEASQESSASASTATPDDATASAPSDAESTSDAPAPDASANTTTSTPDPASSGSEETTDSEAADAEAAEAPATEPSDAASPPQFDPAAGGWSIIVASRTDRAAAESLVETYRDRFDQPLPVGIIEATVDNSTRYRVGVGQFSSRSDAQTFLNEHSDTLPNGAWSVGL